MEKAILSLKDNKAAGPDNIPAEVIKYGGSALCRRLHNFILDCWSGKCLPQQWKNANFILVYKQKVDRAECGNSRGISLLSVAGNVLAKIMLTHLLEHVVDLVLPESQCGFRRGRSTTDMTFVARQLQEKCREQHQDLYLAFVDLTKAFDTVNRDLLWNTAQIWLSSHFYCNATTISYRYVCSSCHGWISVLRLNKRVFGNQNHTIHTKIVVYNAVVISTILYGCETWVPYRRHIRQLESFHIRRLQLILGLRWWHKVAHSEIRSRAGIPTIESMLLHRQIRWLGHVIRMPHSRLTHCVLHGQLRLGCRSVGGQKKRFKDHIKSILKKCNIHFSRLETRIQKSYLEIYLCLWNVIL